jgi:methionyl-tRNA synthetase
MLQYRVDNASLESNPARTHTVVGLALNLALLLASISAPYMPSTAASIMRQLNAGSVKPIPDTFDAEVLKPGHKIGKAEYLFTRIDQKQIDQWKEMFGGTQESRAAEAEAKRKKQEEKERKKASKAKKKAAAATDGAAAAAENSSTAEEQAVAAMAKAQIAEN